MRERGAITAKKPPFSAARSFARAVGGALLAVALCVGFGDAASATAGYASIVVDAQSGRVIHATNSDTRNFPASLTKMMTLYMVFEALESGRWTLNTLLKVSRRAARQPASRLGLEAGETITTRNAILALVTKSANDVATVVAENMSGTERRFALEMTAAARKLGMSRTTFRNASGLPHRGQMSTARDMARLARALLYRHARNYHYFSTAEFSYAGQTYSNHNKLLVTYEGVDGIKTGYIQASGFNLVASAKRGEQRLIGVVFGGRSSAQRNRHMTSLLNKGFRMLGGAPRTQAAARTPPVAATPPAAARTASDNTEDNAGDGPRWGVQVGAYARAAQAYESARAAVDLIPRTLSGGRIQVVALKMRRGKTLHRARILGISKRQAYGACRYLEKRRIPCMELRAPKPMVLAESK